MCEKLMRREVLDRDNSFLGTILERLNGEPLGQAFDNREAQFQYYSVKNRRVMPWRSKLQLYGYYEAELSPQVTCYYAYPHTLEITVEEHMCLFTPDRVDVRQDGTRCIVEIVSDKKIKGEPGYREKLQQASFIYAALGWQFRIADRNEITEEPVFGALELIQSYRKTSVTEKDVLAVASLFRHAEVWSFGDVKAQFSNAATGAVKACAMVARRQLAFDLEHGLNDATPVRFIGGVA